MLIAVAMSGGVDSSTTAALLLEQGHELIGLSIKTHNTAPRGNRACCTPDDMRDARAVADTLGFPLYVLNYAELFQQEVIDPFAKAYLEGKTPNPCVACNEKVKFGPLLDRARLLGAEKLATGHYAQIKTDSQGMASLWRGQDARKDQSYFLARLTQQQLSRLLFPLGHLEKSQVRAHAQRLGLGIDVAQKRESQEICFVGPEGYAKVVESYAPGRQAERGGNIVDEAGRVVGTHAGVHHFTVGQRKGLQLAHSSPRYVTQLDANTREVKIGSQDELLGPTTCLARPMWIADAPAVGEQVLLQQRHRGQPLPARVATIDAEQITLAFDSPTSIGAPGQAGVVYRDGQVLGSGFFDRPAQQRPDTAARSAV